jgi:peptidoglycan/LPS O-acetylase OafA/YrhL
MSSRTLALGMGSRKAPAVHGLASDRGFHIASLDGIRAVAALIVFAAHTHLSHVVPGGFGVTIFFFLSGYLITTLLRREYEETGGIDLKAFYLRRAYRIFPPLYLVLAILLVLTVAGVYQGRVTGGALAAQFAQLTNYYLVQFPSVDAAPVVPYTVPYWSLAVEEHFYLLFPLALLVLLRRQRYPRIALALGAACVAVLAWRCLLVSGLGVPGHYVYHATDTRLDGLLFGCVMGVWMNPALDEPSARWSETAWVALCGLGGALLFASFLYRGDAFRETFRYTFQGMGLFPFFYCAVRFHRWPVFAWLDSKPMRGLGLISYTFYLSHEASLNVAARAVGDHGPVSTLAGFSLTVAFSAACYHLVERRFARLRRRLHG